MTPEQPTETELHEKVVLVETVGSVLWFFMDSFWMLSLAAPAKLMAPPTLLVNLLVFRYTKNSFSQIAVVGAMNSWLLMNIFWMWGDLDSNPRPLEYARIFFAVGMALLGLVIVRNAAQPQRMMQVLSRFRRLRM